MPMSQREFLILQSRSRSDGEFRSAAVAENGRLDIGCRAVNAGLFTSYAVRRDAVVHLVFGGPPDPPVHMAIDGADVSGLHPDESSIAGYIRANLQSFEQRKVPANAGVRMDRRGLEELITDHDGPVVHMHEDGADIDGIATPQDPLFIVGDNRGFTDDQRRVLKRTDTTPVSLGPEAYQAQQVVSYLNIWLDRHG